MVRGKGVRGMWVRDTREKALFQPSMLFKARDVKKGRDDMSMWYCESKIAAKGSGSN
jgi:hypothetical protein